MEELPSPYDTTFRGIKLPPFLAIAKFWIDTLRRIVLNGRILLRCLKVFHKDGLNTLSGLSKLQTLFYLTRGVSGYFFHWRETRCSRKPFIFSELKGALEKSLMTRLDLVNRLDVDGYIVFSEKLEKQKIEKLREFALSTKCFPRCLSEHSGSIGSVALTERASPRYDFMETDLVSNPAVQELISDPTIIEVAQRYLRCRPILDLVAMWWSIPIDGTPFEEGAQAYHFDMDRFRWVKFFLYVNDVNEGAGPHCFIRGSHRPFALPWEILKHGYSRHTDEYVSKFFPKEAFIRFFGESGTMFMEDTRGLHKGEPPTKNHRLVLELEFTGSLFGVPNAPVELPIKQGTRLWAFAKKYPDYFKRYHLTEQKE